MTLLLELFELTITMSAVIALLLFASRLFGGHFTAKCRYLVWFVVILRLCIPIGFSGAAVLLEVSLPEREAVAESTVSHGSDNRTLPAGERIPSASVSPSVPTVPYVPDRPTVTPEETGPSHLTKPNTQPNPAVPQTPVQSTQDVTGENKTSFDFYKLLTAAGILYLTGAIAYLSVRLGTYALFMRRMKRLGALREADTKCVALYSSLTESMALRRAPALRVTGMKISPYLCGYFRPMIVIPESAEDNDGLSRILTHELIHYRRGDVYIKLLCTVAESLHWFNPLVHAAVSRMNSEIELSCDEAVLKEADERARLSYGSTMLELAGRCASVPHGAGLTSHFNPGHTALKKRIMGIVDMKKKKKGIIIIVAAALVCALAGTVIAFNLPESNTPPDAIIGVTDTGETAETAEAAETTEALETDEPQTEAETEAAPTEFAYNTEMLSDIYLDFAALSEKYGRVVKTAYLNGGAGFYFEKSGNTIFVWNPEIAEIGDYESFDAKGNYAGDIPKAGVPVVHIAGKAKGLFQSTESVEVDVLKTIDEPAYVSTEVFEPAGYDTGRDYTTILDFNGITVRIYHNGEDVITSEDVFSMMNKVEGVTMPMTAPRMNENILSSVYRDFYALNKDYGPVVGTSNANIFAGYEFEGMQGVTVKWHSGYAEVDADKIVNGFDSLGVYVGDTPKAGLPASSLRGTVGELFYAFDSLTPEKVDLVPELSLHGTTKTMETDGAPAKYSSYFDFGGSTFVIWHDDEENILPSDTWTLSHLVDGLPIITYLERTGHEILTPSPQASSHVEPSYDSEEIISPASSHVEPSYDSEKFIGSASSDRIALDRTARLDWYSSCGMDARFRDFIESFLTGDLDTLAESLNAERAAMASYEGMVLGDYKIFCNDSGVEFYVEILESSNEVLTPGRHRFYAEKFSTRGEYFFNTSHMKLAGTSSDTMHTLDTKGLAQLVSEELLVNGIYSMDDLRRFVSGETEGFTDAVIEHVHPSIALAWSRTYNASEGDVVTDSTSGTVTLTEEYLTRFVEEFYGEGFTPSHDSGEYYTYSDGRYTTTYKNYRDIPSFYRKEITTRDDGKISVAFSCYADSIGTVKAKDVEFVFEVKDGFVAPVQINVLRDYGLSVAHYRLTWAY